jgi:hypothetical protein
MSASAIHLSLSVNALQRLEQVHHESDFTFIVGDQRYPCPSFVAEFLSPRLCSLRSQDVTIDDFSIETADSSHQFATFLSLGFGHEVSFSEGELSFARSVCGELWNRELFDLTLNDEGGQQKKELKARLDFLSGADGRWGSDASVVASHFHELSVADFDQLSPWVLESILQDPKLVAQDEDSVFTVVHRRASEDLSYFGLLEHVRFEFLSEDCMTRAFDFICGSFDSITFGIWSSLRTRLTLPGSAPLQSGRFKPLPTIDSNIISTLPKIFSVFGEKKFQLIYRASRDGGDARTFHDRCDGHANTFSLILSTNDCIFGGYTPVPWRSRDTAVPDTSLTSFIFTITNPHNLPPKIFKQKCAENAIFDHESYGPRFGGSTADLSVFGEFWLPHNFTYSILGTAYTNDTGIAGNKVLTGDQTFTAKEIEVFELI